MSGNRQVLEALKKINATYELDNGEIDKTLLSMRDAKVNLPLIGKFSSGKSALINTLLARRLLKEDITPETAVPTELSFDASADSALVCYNDGKTRAIGLAEYRSLEPDASTVRCIRMKLRNDFLRRVPDILLVDMPGFESGYEIHNKAIDNYLPQSLAYLVAFPADDLILRESVSDILKELRLNEMPVAIVITKRDKGSDDFDKSLQSLLGNLKRVLGKQELPVLITSAADGNASELADYLVEMQGRSGELLERRFRADAIRALNATETFLKTSLRNASLGESQLKEEEERLQRQLKELNESMRRERAKMESEVSECAELIKTDVQDALEADEETLVTLILNKSNISGRVNALVRRAVTAGVKRHLTPVVDRYIARIASGFRTLSAGDITIDMDFETWNINQEMSSSLVGLMSNPILKVIVTFVSTLVNAFLSLFSFGQAKDKIRAKVKGEIIPEVMDQIEEGLEREISNQIDQINAEMEKRLDERRAAIDKAMSDLKRKMNEETEEKERYVAGLEQSLQEVSALRETL
ncbi:MAG: dynamin family protein [Oscillibacter sp.]|nr:dynamin family protein [Oscillibacter sp.]